MCERGRKEERKRERERTSPILRDLEHDAALDLLLVQQCVGPCGILEWEHSRDAWAESRLVHEAKHTAELLTCAAVCANDGEAIDDGKSKLEGDGRDRYIPGKHEAAAAPEGPHGALEGGTPDTLHAQVGSELALDGGVLVEAAVARHNHIIGSERSQKRNLVSNVM
jgi:hypothetical protein